MPSAGDPAVCAVASAAWQVPRHRRRKALTRALRPALIARSWDGTPHWIQDAADYCRSWRRGQEREAATFGRARAASSALTVATACMAATLCGVQMTTRMVG